MLGHLPRKKQNIFLNACDLAIVSLIPAMTGYGVPSRLYNILAAGKPLIALTGQGSEISNVVLEEKIGFFIEAGNPKELSRLILKLNSVPNELKRMGKLSRLSAEKNYNKIKILSQYKQIIDSL